MKTIKSANTLFVVATLLLCGMAQSASAQNGSSNVHAQLSTREAFVGQPVILQLSINDATDYDQPTAPEIDGCDVRSSGTPSQSSQITIINGRRSESRSVTMQYLITPRRAGAFEIPAMTVNVNGRDQETQPLRFVATKSETGDLLFVEIAGAKGKVFVGQPLDLTLKIWIKPFADRENEIKLSEANMWQLISEQTSWGSFTDRMKELAENDQRPGGQEVLRDDGQGNERSYYLYEIDATVYPKRPGKIVADDVQIVVNYPTAIGKSRDSFDSFFGGSPFGGMGGMSSRMRQMMNDDFFGGSSFGSSLSVTSSRPIVGEVTVDSTEVIPVPTEGRPADYRGAVGRYKIATQATPAAVSAGDPITFKIGVAGTGPMELVQAPPLSELLSLTNNFKVADQSLAGFVKDDTKVFSTTIRPRREGITTIPPIPFSFFDPDTEKFETVMSEPISITVDKSESLALDAIIGNARRDRSDESTASTNSRKLEPNFTNNDSASILVSQSPAASGNWWLAFVFVPPVIWFVTLLVRNRDAIGDRLPRFRSPHTQCLSAIDLANTREQIENALERYIAKWLRLPASVSDRELRQEAAVTAVGALRTSGMYTIANEVESILQCNSHSAFTGATESSLSDLQQSARELVNRMEGSFAAMNKSQVRRSKRRCKPRSDGGNTKQSRPRTFTQKVTMLLIAAPLAFSTTTVTAASSRSDNEPNISRSALASGLGNSIATRIVSEDNTAAGSLSHEDRNSLTGFQRETILTEASQFYAKATAIAKTDSAEANDLFTTAASKYQLLVDSGVRNSELYTSLGNACLQSNQLGHAIANYERAKTLDPTNRQLAANLDFANSLVKRQESTSRMSASPADASAASTSLASIIGHLRTVNQTVTYFIGPRSIIWTLAISSLLFWVLLTARAFGYLLPVKRIAIVPLILLVLSAVSYGLTTTTPTDNFNGIIVANNVTLHTGDGDQFVEVTTLETAQGHRVQVLGQRGDWVRVETAAGHTGWLRRDLDDQTIPIG